MKEPRASLRYAKALLDLAIDKKSLEEVYSDVQGLHNTFANSKELILFLKSPIIKTDKKEIVLKEIFGSNVNKLTWSFIAIVNQKGRESILPEIADTFIQLYKNHYQILSAKVITAVKLDDATKAQIAALLNKESKQIEIEEIIDPSVLGGFIVKIGDKQIDSSVKNKLTKFKHEFSHNLYESKI